LDAVSSGCFHHCSIGVDIEVWILVARFAGFDQSNSLCLLSIRGKIVQKDFAEKMKAGGWGISKYCVCNITFLFQI
jgi:hypothetical protein